MSQNIIKQIKALIADNNIEDAAKQLVDYLRGISSSHENESIVHLSSIKEIVREERLGIKSNEFIQQRKSQVKYALLDLIKNIEQKSKKVSNKNIKDENFSEEINSESPSVNNPSESSNETYYDKTIEYFKNNKIITILIIIFIVATALLGFYKDLKDVFPFNPDIVIIDPSKNKTIIDFSKAINPKITNNNYIDASPFLNLYGVSIRDIKPNTSTVIIQNKEGPAVRATYSVNCLTMDNTNNEAASFTLEFKNPVKSISFTLPELFADSENGVTFPSWSAHAFDKSGKEIISQSRDIERSYSTIPIQIYTLTIPGFDYISKVRFDSDPNYNGSPHTAFSAILIEQLTFTR